MLPLYLGGGHQESNLERVIGQAADEACVHHLMHQMINRTEIELDLDDQLVQSTLSYTDLAQAVPREVQRIILGTLYPEGHISYQEYDMDAIAPQSRRMSEMEWERLATVPDVTLVHDVVACGDMLIARGTTSVMGWNPHDATLAWVHELPGDEMFAMKRLYAVGDEVITIVVTAFGLPKQLVCLDAATGRVVRQLDCPLQTSQEGFAVAGDIVFVHGRSPARKTRCLRVHARSGERLSEEEAPGGGALMPLADKMYLHGRSQGWFYAEVQGGPWHHLDVGGIGSAAAGERQLFFFLVPSSAGTGWPLACWDDAQQRERGRIVMDVPQALMLAPAGEPGLVAAYLEAIGLRMMDLDGGRELWRLQPAEGWAAATAVGVPGGMAMPAGSVARPSHIEVRGLRTGEIQAKMPLDPARLSYLYWAHDVLVVSSMSGLTGFRLAAG